MSASVILTSSESDILGAPPQAIANPEKLDAVPHDVTSSVDPGAVPQSSANPANPPSTPSTAANPANLPSTPSATASLSDLVSTPSTTGNLADLFSSPSTTAGAEVLHTVSTKDVPRRDSSASQASSPTDATFPDFGHSFHASAPESKPIIIQVNLPGVSPQYGLTQTYEGPQRNEKKQVDDSPQNDMKILVDKKKPDSTPPSNAIPPDNSSVTNDTKVSKTSPQTSMAMPVDAPHSESKVAEGSPHSGSKTQGNTTGSDTSHAADEHHELGIPYSQLYKASLPPELYGQPSLKKKSVSQTLLEACACCCGRRTQEGPTQPNSPTQPDFILPVPKDKPDSDYTVKDEAPPEKPKNDDKPPGKRKSDR